MKAAKTTGIDLFKGTVANWESADAALHMLGNIDNEIAHDQAELAEAIAKTKADYDEHISGLIERRKHLIKAIESFVKGHKTDLEGKSRTLTFGTVGYRKSPPKIKLLWAAERVIEALRLKKLVNCIRTIEEPNKDTLKLLDADTLAAVGVKLSGGKDKFFAEPDLATIEEKP